MEDKYIFNKSQEKWIICLNEFVQTNKQNQAYQ